MKIGSSMILTTDPSMVPVMEAVAKPSVRSRLEGVKDRMIKGAPNTIKV